MRWVWVTLFVPACGFAPIQANGDGSVGVDAIDPIDGRPDVSTVNDFCVGAAPVRICLSTTPTTTLANAGDLVVDTGIDKPLCRNDVVVPDDDSLCVVAFAQAAIMGKWSASGTRPFVIVVAGDLHVMGSIDVASHANGMPQANGADANPSDCGSGTAATNHGGGAGGSFGGVGGNGAMGGGTGATPNPADPGAGSLRGGCKGSDGAGGSVDDFGNGGGALAVVVGGTLTVDGMIDASGSAGIGGQQSGGQGGGGGGSGGMIVLHANVIAGAGGGRIFAAGAGGGEGGGNKAGNNGSEPTGMNLSTGAPGGTGGTANAGDGGAGSTIASTAGSVGLDGNPNTGGGGGGGGAGVVIVHAGTTTFAGMFSPAP